MVSCLARSRLPESWAVPPPSPSAVPSGATASMLDNHDLADCTLVLRGGGGAAGGAEGGAATPGRGAGAAERAAAGAEGAPAGAEGGAAERMPVHWFVLYTQSEYWRAMFRAGMQEVRAMEVEIHDVEPAVMRQVVRFLYTGELALSEANAQDVLMAAVRYQIRSLIHVAEAYISRQVCAENALAVLRIATQHGCARLRGACLAFLLRGLPELVACRASADSLDEQTIDGLLAVLKEWLAEPAREPTPPHKRARLSAPPGRDAA